MLGLSRSHVAKVLSLRPLVTEVESFVPRRVLPPVRVDRAAPRRPLGPKSIAFDASMSSNKRDATTTEQEARARSAQPQKRARSVQNSSTLSTQGDEAVGATVDAEKGALGSTAPRQVTSDPHSFMNVTSADEGIQLPFEFPKLPCAPQLMWEVAASGLDTASHPGVIPRGFRMNVVSETRVLYGSGPLIQHKVPYSTSQKRDLEDGYERRAILDEQHAFMSTQVVDFVPACSRTHDTIVSTNDSISSLLDVVHYELKMACQQQHKARLDMIESQDMQSLRHSPPPEARKAVVWLLLPTAGDAKHYTSSSLVDCMDAFAYLASSKGSNGQRLAQVFRFAVACNGVDIRDNRVDDADTVMKFCKLPPFPKSEYKTAVLLVLTMSPEGQALTHLVDLNMHIPEISLSRTVRRSEAWDSSVGRYANTLISSLSFSLEALGLHDHAGALMASVGDKEPYAHALLIEQSLAARRFYNMLDLKGVDFIGDEAELTYFRNLLQPLLSEELLAERVAAAKKTSPTDGAVDGSGDGSGNNEADNHSDDDFMNESTSVPPQEEEPPVSPYADKLVCAGFMRMTERGLLLTKGLEHAAKLDENGDDYINAHTSYRNLVRAKLNRFSDYGESEMKHYATKGPALYESMPAMVWCEPSCKEDVARVLCNNWHLDPYDYLRRARVVFCFVWSSYVNMRGQLGYYSMQSCIKDAQPRPNEGMHMLQTKLAVPSSTLLYEYCFQPCSIESLAPSEFHNAEAAFHRMDQFESLLNNLGEPHVCPIWKYLNERNALPQAWSEKDAMVEKDEVSNVGASSAVVDDQGLDGFDGGYGGIDGSDLESLTPYGVGSAVGPPKGTTERLTQPTTMRKLEVRDAARELMASSQSDAIKKLAPVVSLMVRRFGPLVDLEAAVAQLVEEVNNNRVVLAKEQQRYKLGDTKLTPLEAYSRLLG